MELSARKKIDFAPKILVYKKKRKILANERGSARNMENEHAKKIDLARKILSTCGSTAKL